MNIVISTWTELIQQFFPIFTAPGADIFSGLITGWILCTAQRTVTGIIPFADPGLQHAHDAYHRFFPAGRWPLAGEQTLEDTDSDAGQNLLSNRSYSACPGRYTVSPQWPKDQRGRLLERRRPIDKEKHRLCMGTESGSSDLADTTALGRRTVGPSCQHEIASQKRPNPDRIGCPDDRAGSSMVAEKAFSSGRGWFLCYSCRQRDDQYTSCIENTTQRKDFRSAA